MANDIIKIKRALNQTDSDATSLQEGEFLYQLDNKNLYIGGLTGKDLIISKSELDNKVDNLNGTATDLNVEGTLTINGVDVLNTYNSLAEMGLNDATTTMGAVHSLMQVGERLVINGSLNPADGNHSVFINSIVETLLASGDYTAIVEIRKVGGKYSTILYSILNDNETEYITMVGVFNNSTKKIQYTIIPKDVKDNVQTAVNIDAIPTYKGFPFAYVSHINFYVIFSSTVRVQLETYVDRNNPTYPYLRQSISTYDPNFSSNMATGMVVGQFNEANGKITSSAYLHVSSANSILTGYTHVLQGYKFSGKFERSVA